MARDIFATQFDGCTYVSGGKNCTCACHRMWLFRASGGRINLTSCQCRREARNPDGTPDKVGGTNLRQMQAIAVKHGITKGVLYLPEKASVVVDALMTGRFGTHWNLCYAPFVGTIYDVFHGGFKGNHDDYVRGPGKTPGTLSVADPGGKAYRDIPTALMVRAAGMLRLNDSGTETIDSEYGRGRVFAYVTPPDPVVDTWWPDYIEPPTSQATFAVQFRPGRYPLLDSNGKKIGTFPTPNGFTAYGNTRKRRESDHHLIGKLITDRPGDWIDTTTANNYWSN